MKMQTIRDHKGNIIVRFEHGVIGFFHREVAAAVVEGVEIDVMIVGRGKEVRKDGYPKVVFVRPVGKQHKLIQIDGFERSGSQVATADITGVSTGMNYVTRGFTLPVYVAGNEAGDTPNMPAWPKIPMWVYVREAANTHNDRQLPDECVGLTSLCDMDCVAPTVYKNLKVIAQRRQRIIEDVKVLSDYRQHAKEAEQEKVLRETKLPEDFFLFEFNGEGMHNGGKKLGSGARLVSQVKANNKAVAEKREVRITDNNDEMRFHSKDGVTLHNVLPFNIGLE
jgi:hypothetical protein